VLLAFMPEEERANILKNNTLYKGYSKQQQKNLLAAFDKIAKEGYHVESSNLSKGVTDIVVPIGDPRTQVTATLALSILTTEYNESLSIEEIISEVQKCAQAITGRLGYRP